MTPIVQGDTLVYQQDGHEQTLAVGTGAWYSWLETASTFAFASDSGTFTARREQSGHKRGGWYWKAYRKQHGKLSSTYLGKPEGLTLDRLNAAAQRLAPARAADAKAATSRAAAPPGPGSSQADPLHPLLATKLHKPLPRTQLVRRPHLTERLTQGVAGPLTLVSAPAGFGKTTLLAQWLVESPMPVAWLSLEPEDNEPVRFLSYVIAALQTLDPHIGTAAFNLLQMPQPAAPETVLTLLTNDVVSRQREGGDFALVLDDYHVIQAAPIHHTLLFLLEHLPPQMHLILLTRADPPLPLSRLRARGQLTELRVAELRFAAHEVSAFLRTVMGLDLSPEAMATLEGRTEGWIAGLQLAALSLRGRTDVSAYLAAFTGSHRFVLDYLSQEVLARQDASVQAFLLHTAVLDRLSGPLCEAVTGQGGGQALLEALEDANLFVVSLDDQRRWYRYHHLFADVLRNRLQQADPLLVPALHRRASSWYEQQGLVVEAVQHAVAAQDVEQTAHLIEAFGLSIALQGQTETVFGWLKGLPDSLVRTRPSLCLLHAVLLLFTIHLEGAEAYLQDAEAALGGDVPAEQQQVFRGQIATVRANILHYSGDIVQSVALARQALGLLPETEEAARAPALLLAASAYLTSGDVIPETTRLVMGVTRPMRASGNVFATFSSFTILARMYILQGQLHQAAATFEEAVQLAPREEVLQALVGRPAYFIGVADLFREWNDLAAAERYMTCWWDMMKRETLAVEADMLTLGYTVLARLQQARGAYGSALSTLEAFTNLAHRRSFVPHLVSQGSAVRAQLELAQGNLTSAIRWADATGLSADDELSYLHERGYLSLARVRIAQGRDDPAGPFLRDALRLLERLLQDAEVKARMGSALEILILQSLALHALGDRARAFSTLEHVLTQASPEGYVRLFVDEGTAMLSLLRQARKHGIVPDYVAILLSAFGEQPEGGSSLQVSRPVALVEPLTEREREVLQLLVAGASNREIARRLIVSLGTAKKHISNICGKLGVQSRTQAIAKAHALHLL